MNKYIFKTMLCSALALPLLTSCELDQFPEDSLPTEKTWEKISDAENYYIGLLSNLRAVAGGAHAYVSEAQSDLFNARTGTAELNQVHQWTFTTSQFDGDAVWVGNYNLIANANNIINNIDNIEVEEGSEAEMYLQMYKGSALFARALAYTNMVTRYCENYDAATADSKLGLPLVLTVDVNAKPARATLAETYAQIKSDIAAANTLLAPIPQATDRPSLDAVKALDARVSFQMKDYANAITLSEELIARYPLAGTADDFASMWLNDAGDEIIFQPEQTVDERTNPYSTIFIYWDAAQQGYSPYFIPTQGLLDLYEAEDMRFSAYFAKVDLSVNSTTEEGYMLVKYPGNPALKKSNEHEYYNMTKVFRAAEFYLIAAEASYMQNGTDGGYLNQLRTQRGATAVTATGEELWKEIKNEWIREMVGEGFRLDCLKRWGEGFKRMTPQAFSEKMLITTAGYIDLSISADNMKFVWEIPSQDLQSNTNLERNWKSAE